MEDDKISICRLCFKTCETDFTVHKRIKDTTKHILNFVLLNLDLDISDEPVMCNSCINNLEECYNFKTICLYAMDITAIKVETIQLNAPNLPFIENIANATETFGCCNICCSCAKMVNNEDSILLANVEKSMTAMLEKYLPKLVLNDVPNFMCIACYKSLQNQLTFICNCMVIEEKIKEYCKVEGTNSKGQVELNKVLYFTSKNQLQKNIHNNVNGDKIEQSCEDTEIEDRVKIKTEDLIEIEEPGLYYMESGDVVIKKKKDGDDRFDHSVHKNSLELPMPNQESSLGVTLFKCGECTYECKRKNKLSRHMYIHKNTLYECELCTYHDTSKHNFSTHLATHKHPSMAISYECNKCTFKTSWKGISRHMLTHDISSKVIKYVCRICAFQTYHKGNLLKHIQLHRAGGPSNARVYKCKECTYHSIRKYHVTRHMMTHRKRAELKMDKRD